MVLSQKYLICIENYFHFYYLCYEYIFGEFFLEKLSYNRKHDFGYVKISFLILQIAFQKFEKGINPTKTSSYNLRPLLWEAGSTVSNKVLECLVLRFAKNKILTAECFIMAMVRLHLAHGKIMVFMPIIL